MTQERVWVFYDSIAKLQSNALTQDEAQSAIMKIRAYDIARFFIWTQGWQDWQPLKTYLESDQKIFVSTFTISRSNEETIKAVARDVREHTITQTITRFPFGDDEPTNAGVTNAGTFTGTDSAAFSHIVLTEDTMSRYLNKNSPEYNSLVDFDGEELTFSNIKKPKMDFSDMLANKKMDNRAVRHELKIETLLISSRGKTFRTTTKNISLSGILAETMIPFEFYNCVFDIVVISSIQSDPRKARVKLQAETIIEGGQRTQRLKYINLTPQQKGDLQNLMEEYLVYTRKKKKSA
jgi:hypothetical protein